MTSGSSFGTDGCVIVCRFPNPFYLSVGGSGRTSLTVVSRAGKLVSNSWTSSSEH